MDPKPKWLQEAVVARVAIDHAYETVMAQGASCGWCARPIRLVGQTVTADAKTGEVVDLLSSAFLPGGELVKACGTRRATLCASCSARFQGDARRLILLGVAGDDDDTAGIASRPKIFATLTAPSFGPVHRHRPEGGPCHPGPPGPCPHGKARRCMRDHPDDDPRLGEALCSDCYDYASAVLFNATLSELWRRTMIYSIRNLARLAGCSEKTLRRVARVEYVKVVELQRRGVAHVHAVLRLDGVDGADPPPDLSAGLLIAALRRAAREVRVPLPAGHGEVRWGTQFDAAAVLPGIEAEARRAANYLAKYATKSAADSGALDHRVRSEDQIDRIDVSPQIRRMVATAWELGARPELAYLRLRRWAHALGVRGHFLTKSRRFSTTFGALRAIRQEYRKAQTKGVSNTSQSDDDREVVRVSDWELVAQGWRSEADALLVASRARSVADARREARLAAETGP